MNNGDDKDKLRFNKLYQLLGEEINNIYNEPSDDIKDTVDREDNITDISFSDSSIFTDEVEPFNENLFQVDNDKKLDKEEDTITDISFSDSSIFTDEVEPFNENVSQVDSDKELDKEEDTITDISFSDSSIFTDEVEPFNENVSQVDSDKELDKEEDTITDISFSNSNIFTDEVESNSENLFQVDIPLLNNIKDDNNVNTAISFDNDNTVSNEINTISEKKLQIEDDKVSNKEDKSTSLNDDIAPKNINPTTINTETISSNTSSNFEINGDNNYRNKTIITSNNSYEDINYENVSDKKTIKDVLTGKSFIFVVAILTFICVCIVVAKAFYFGKKVDHYEDFFTEITEKEDNSVKIYENSDIDNDVLKKMAASELINCISSPINMSELPGDINDVINEINNYYNTSNNYFAFAYKDIFTGFTVTYNANQSIFTASAIKGPTDIYIYEMASQGKVNLDEVVTYTAEYYNTGSGVLKNKPINSQYSIRTLLEYSTVTSDNAAHNMLMDKYGRQNMLNFWKEKGTTAIFTVNNNWGVMNANDALIYMNELYNFYAKNNEYGEELMKNFLKAYPTFLKGNGNYLVANKSGWSGTAIHDIAIVFADNPYIVVALSNTGTSDYTNYFDNANRLAYKLHETYWKYKINTCNSIKQY